VATWLNHDGYPKLHLSKDGKQTNHRVHRLVALAFLGEHQNALHSEVAHLDGDRSNCRAGNLKWVSRGENFSHRRLHGTHPSGERHPRAKLTEKQVSAIRASQDRRSVIAERYGISPLTVTDIRSGKRWAHSVNRG
jgi:hypothetical protein